MPKWILPLLAAVGPIAKLLNNIFRVFFPKKTSKDTHEEIKDHIAKRKEQEKDKLPPKDRFPGV